MRTIIIGATAAGTSAAAKAKRTNPDLDITLYEKRDYVSFGACGLPYFVGEHFEDPNQMIARTPEKFAQQGIDVQLEHEVLSVDFDEHTIVVRDLKTNQDRTEFYDQLMLATGATAVMPPIKNVDLKNVYHLRTMADGQALRELGQDPKVQSVTVIGAGFIGLEIAEEFHQLGKQVRVIQLEDRILPLAFDPELTDMFADDLRDNGIELHLSEAVQALEGTDQVTGIVTDKGQYATDLVIVAAGIRPNTQFITDDRLKKLPNGAIIVDQAGRTSIENVYAAGDNATVINSVTNQPMYSALATGANKLGRIVGTNLGGQAAQLPGMLNSAGVKLIMLEAGRTGLTEKEATEAGIDFSTVLIHDKNQTNYYPGQSDLTIKLIYTKAEHILIGGQVVGQKDAVLRVDVLATAIQAKMTTEQLGLLDLVYAPPFARTWDALNVAGNVAH
ncbi:CoA-disulfide reductase [Latilactobacillus curvatus]|uniref:CoA-disulfide reductase n=1 Tax=Latilactobacillus curvatus TaxID=28038 RepID=A0AAC9Y082_LATCU|nr:CoA-disulfide reductase [Latilactobacillus curvatus]ASN59387.1 CoA-disulfide reductase [Latilactobacillus curvatus]MDT3393707.1 CoA-disulfide reductase [Bacillota bacterium]